RRAVAYGVGAYLEVAGGPAEATRTDPVGCPGGAGEAEAGLQTAEIVVASNRGQRPAAAGENLDLRVEIAAASIHHRGSAHGRCVVEPYSFGDRARTWQVGIVGPASGVFRRIIPAIHQVERIIASFVIQRATGAIGLGADLQVARGGPIPARANPVGRPGGAGEGIAGLHAAAPTSRTVVITPNQGQRAAGATEDDNLRVEVAPAGVHRRIPVDGWSVVEPDSLVDRARTGAGQPGVIRSTGGAFIGIERAVRECVGAAAQVVARHSRSGTDGMGADKQL